MLLPDASPETILKTMLDEREKLRYYVDKEKSKSNLKKIFFDKTEGNLVYHSKVITVPSSGNRYLLWVYFEKDWSRIHDNWTGYKNLNTGYALMMTNRDGTLDYYILAQYRNAHPIFDDLPVNGSETRVYTLSMFTGHFLSRYRERAGIRKSFTADKLAIHFFIRNVGSFLSEKKETFNGQNKTDSKKRAYVINDGFSMAEFSELNIPNYPPCQFIKHNTFITEAMMTKDQKETSLAKIMKFQQTNGLKNPNINV